MIVEYSSDRIVCPRYALANGKTNHHMHVSATSNPNGDVTADLFKTDCCRLILNGICGIVFPSETETFRCPWNTQTN